jgi:hydroxymethylglutaryl-CoA reductase
MAEDKRTSAIPGFYKLKPSERLAKVREFSGLSDEEAAGLAKEGALPSDVADKMIENFIGFMPVPMGVATNFIINGKEYLVPMAIEEPSVIAAASNGAKMCRSSGGFKASASEPLMIGQIQLAAVPDAAGQAKKLAKDKAKLLAIAKELTASLEKYGGGARDVEVRLVETKRGSMLVIHIVINTGDAMGANTINSACEKMAPKLEEMTGGKARLRILSNLAVKRLANASATWKKEELGGEEVVDAMLDAYELAACDQFRAATHNKGIMNGVDAVALATGNDWRAVEAGSHAYAAFGKSYSSLTKYAKDKDGNLVGSIELPLAVGLVGGATKTHPAAKAGVKILGVKTSQELACVMASVGLAQNFAALRALSTEGIQRGHMELHARNIAINAGASGGEVEEVALRLIREGNVKVERAKQALEEIRKAKKQ